MTSALGRTLRIYMSICMLEFFRFYPLLSLERLQYNVLHLWFYFNLSRVSVRFLSILGINLTLHSFLAYMYTEATGEAFLTFTNIFCSLILKVTSEQAKM